MKSPMICSKERYQFLPTFALIVGGMTLSCFAEVTVELDVAEVPELSEWGERGQGLLKEWHPRIANLLSSPGFEPPNRLSLKLKQADQGVGETSGTRITVFSNWIQKRPDDFGLLIHEMVHVIQRYPQKEPEWVTEGIADYIRWAIYEGKSQADFPVPRSADGYKQGYQPAAGFLLWLETNQAPGIVRRLNTAMRNSTYSAEIFTQLTGKDLDSLWAEYAKARQRTEPGATEATKESGRSK